MAVGQGRPALLEVNANPSFAIPTPIDIETKAERYCRFRKKGIKYIDYKDADFLLMLCNPQGKILPRRLTGTSLKYQRKAAQAIKKARHLALMPYVADNLR